MKLAFAFTTILGLTHVSLAEECWLGQESQLAAVDWSAEENELGGTTVSIAVKNNFNKDLTSALARAFFSSTKGPLDDHGVGSGPIFPQHIAAGQTRTIGFATDASEYRQLIGAKKDKFRLQLCVQSLRFKDGTEQRLLSPLSNQ